MYHDCIVKDTEIIPKTLRGDKLRLFSSRKKISMADDNTQTPPNPKVLQNPARIIADFSHSFQMTQHKLTGSNFQEWYQSVLLVIKGKGKMGYLTGEITALVSTDPNYKTWEAGNSIVMAWLINLMDPQIGRTYLFYNTTHEIWTTVQEMFSDLHNSSECFEIRSAILSKVTNR